jgi:hypothetical protein
MSPPFISDLPSASDAGVTLSGGDDISIPTSQDGSADAPLKHSLTNAGHEKVGTGLVS